MSTMTIYTVGHSTRKRSDLVALLKHYNVELLIDIRAIPYSRYNPQFNKETMEEMMPETPIGYEHLASLGGIRPSKEVMSKAKSCSERSRGFAEYMLSDSFKGGIRHVLERASAPSVIALMCAESDPSHCHRFWVADALQADGIAVKHIVSENDVRDHPENLFTYT